jgi:hypothetical protein
VKHTLIAILVAAVMIPLVSGAADKQFPSPKLVGTWTGSTEVFGPFKVEPYPSKAPEDHQNVILTIKADGTVAGKIGNAEFKDASVKRNRGLIGRKLNIKTDYIVCGGTLQGKVTPRDEGTNSRFTIPFNLEGGTLRGTIMLLPKFPLTRQLNLTKHQDGPDRNREPAMAGERMVGVTGFEPVTSCM